jgi:Hg(II)-responsive transcriptional regulator
MRPLTVGKLAKTSGVNTETVRYYERIGLIPKPHRKESGYRQYSQEDVSRLKFILHAKELGFSLKEIRELLELRVEPETNCEEVRGQAELKIADIEKKIADLRRIRTVLMKLTTACKKREQTDECPILEALEAEN